MTTYDYKLEPISAMWNKLESAKSAVLTRAVDCSKITIPSVFPPDGFNDENTLDDVNQSFGARAVLNLSSKLVQTLFPPTFTFFKLSPTKEIEEQIMLNEQVDVASMDLLQQQLVKLETGIMSEFERQSLRSIIYEAIKLLIVTGNALIWKDGNTNTILNLRNYCVKRDSTGTIIDVIVREKINPLLLPEGVKTEEQPKVDSEEVFVYTRIVFDGENYQMYQEFEDVVINGSEYTFKKGEVLPFIVLRWTSNSGSHYGRGLVEHYLGDLRNYEALNIVLTDIASVMARTLFLVNPNSEYGTNVEQLNNAVTGDYIAGHANDITVPQVNKNSDMSVILQLMQHIEQRLSQAFLLFTTRQAERVTAQEIREVAQALEETLGGVYALLSETLQKPLLLHIMNDLNIDFKGQVEAVITTGVEALGRGADSNRLLNALEMLQLIPDAQNFLKTKTLVERIVYSNGIPLDNLVKTDEELQAEQEQAMQQQSMMGMDNAVSSGLGNAIPQMAQQYMNGE